MSTSDNNDGKKEAVKTYIEQTKLLVTLASAFVLAPAGFIAFLKDRTAAGISNLQLSWFVAAEALFVVSVFSGYVVLASIAGYQALSRYDVYRPATKYASLLQIGTYLAGIAVFVYLSFILSTAPIAAPKS